MKRTAELIIDLFKLVGDITGLLLALVLCYVFVLIVAAFMGIIHDLPLTAFFVLIFGSAIFSAIFGKEKYVVPWTRRRKERERAEKENREKHIRDAYNRKVEAYKQAYKQKHGWLPDGWTGDDAVLSEQYGLTRYYGTNCPQRDEY
jgi:hypothetical protein